MSEAKRKTSGKVWFARGRAAIWMVLTPCALLWWPTSVAFVIVASMYANFVTDISVAEAADDSAVMARLDDHGRLLTDHGELLAKVLERLDRCTCGQS